MFVLGCSTVGGCPNSKTTFAYNIVRGYANPLTYNGGGNAGGPSLFYVQDNTAAGGPQQVDISKLGTFTRIGNVYFGVRGVTCNATERCADPLFVSEPSGNDVTFTEAELDGFNTALQSGSPATGLGAAAQVVGTASTVVTPPPPPPVVTPPPVVPASPTITWNNPVSIVSGTALSSTQLNAKASTAGTFVYTPAAGVVPALGTDTLTVTFTPTDLVNFTTVTKAVKIVVSPPPCTRPIALSVKGKTVYSGCAD
jgi:hypothetical protein